jgi:hypothetical protein
MKRAVRWILEQGRIFENTVEVGEAELKGGLGQEILD